MSVLNVDSDIDTLKLILRAMYGESRDRLAWELIKRFGDVCGVFAASSDELCRVPGMTKRVALFFDTYLPLKRQAALREAEERRILCRRDAVEFCRLYFSSELTPAKLLLCLDGSGRIKGIEKFNIKENLREIVVRLCSTNAEKFIVVRYSVSAPGLHDMEQYAEEFLKLEDIGTILGARFMDCIAFVGDKAFSLCDGSLTETDESDCFEYIERKTNRRY